MRAALELRGRCALVTGGRGFIGSHLTDRLILEGAEVHATSRATVESGNEGVRWWETDLLDLESLNGLLRQIQPDFVFHLAGHVSADPRVQNVLPTYHGLLTSTVNLLTLLSSEIECSRILLAGSLTEPPAGQVDTAPSSPYAAAKWAAGAYGRMVHLLYRTPVVIARTFMGYGPRQHRSKLIPYAISSLMQNQTPSFASGAWAADWIYIDDVIEGLVRAATAPQVEGATIDLGTGELTPIKEVIRRIVAITGTSVEPRFGALPDRIDEVVRVADVAATYERLGWKPTVSLDQGLASTVRWFIGTAAR